MITWGLFSCATAFVTGAISFARPFASSSAYAEAGLLPRHDTLLHLLVPGAHRGRVVRWFMTAIPVSIVLGAPISTLLLEFDGIWGLRGWSWLFIGEAVPAVILGFVVLFYL